MVHVDLGTQFRVPTQCSKRYQQVVIITASNLYVGKWLMAKLEKIHCGKSLL